MTKYDNLMQFRNAGSAQKLAILRTEMSMPISTIQGYAHLLKQIDPKAVNGLPEDFGGWIDALIEAGDDLKELLEILTDIHN